MRYSQLVSFLLILSLARATAGAVSGDLHACEETRGPVVERCFEIHGRASYWNGTPSLRIWHIGTHHIFGVRDDKGPDALERALAAGDGHHDLFANIVYGDFTICPYTHYRRGAMQFVCVSQARNLRLVVDRRRL